MYELARPAIYSYSIQRGTPHVNLRQKRASLFNSQILVVALIGIFGGLKPKMCVHFSKDWRSVRHSSPTSIKLTTQSYPSLLLYTIPLIDISTKFPQLRELHPTSPPPPYLVSSNKTCKPQRIDHL